MATECKPTTGWSRRFSLRALLVAVMVVCLISAWTAARLKKLQTEQRITSMCIRLGASISLTGEDRGWIKGLHFSNPTTLNDEHLMRLAKLEHLEVLHLNQTQVTGAGLEALADFPALRELHVNEWQLTPRGIQHLEELNQLRTITFWGLPSNDPRVVQVLQSLPNTNYD
ncbi:MAG: hypothetical protein KDA57_21695 [Planctomycetales bacterium]|nr:hypothetical protein [Planctomycetales bacterium]